MTTPNDPPLYDVDEAMRKIDALRRTTDPDILEYDRIAKRIAELTARHFTPSSQQAAGEALLVVAASLQPVARRLPGLALSNVFGLVGLHLAPLSPANYREAR